MNIDEEIKQDFLVEAGELYDLLNDQLADLEKKPQDSDLLNAIFRAFHTIKGGAGFLELLPMVEVCHRAEDVFDRLRNDKIKVDSALVNVVFEVLDALGDMFESIHNDEPQQSASPSLLQSLDSYLNDDANTNSVTEFAGAHSSNTTSTTESNDDVNVSMDDEFEQLRQLAINNENSNNSQSVSDDLITDDEFDNLLDEIHGKGKHNLVAENVITNDNNTASKGNNGELITDDEFENLLDQMHGKNKGSGSMPSASSMIDEKAENKKITTTDVADNSDVHTSASTFDKVTKKKDSRTKEPKKKDSSVRVDTERLDDIMNLVGELVLVRNRLSMLKQDVKQDHVSDAITTLELITTDLQASVMKTRMQPIKKVFSRFPRVIRDLAKKLNKEIVLELVGEDTDLDKSLVEALADPLIHLVRNSADHGVETPEERFSAGKARHGTITLSAKQEGDQVLLTVTDDGKGMDADVFRKKAIEAGMLNEDAAKSLSDKDAFNLIFAPGFSTKTEISDVSGRGVGMDVVKTRINELNGSIEIDSTPGKGSVITINLPLTMAILPTLMIKLDAYQFALPLNNVYEAFNMEPDTINIVDKQEIIRVRDETLPLFYLHPWLVRNNSFDGPNLEQKVIVVQMGNLRFCLVVDNIVGQEEVVIKPLGAMLNTTAGFSGATITGDGDIALVLDMPGLMNKYAVNSVVC